ncbi:hypothetical protein Q9290_14410, partial [Oceanimonas sp. CHS3-5]|uniref:hypothetical protein n=1 Tax=Oceanimonas sp. CHS3-5 TaxID=3068186 RepID=UPI00273E9E8D
MITTTMAAAAVIITKQHAIMKKGASAPFLLPVSRPEYGLHLSPEDMETPMGQGVKRTQRDYSLTFKLALVEQIE